MFPSRKKFYCLLFGLLAIGVWVNYGELDIVTSAEGIVVPSKKIQKIQHLEGGIIRSIEVIEGQLVEKGDPLITLETTASESELNELESQKSKAVADLVRLEGELNNFEEPRFSKEKMDIVLIEKSMSLFRARKASYQNRMQIQQNEILEKTQEKNEIRERVKKNKKYLVLINEKIEISAELMKDDLSNKMEHLTYLEREAEISGRIKEDYWAEKRAQTEIQRARLRIKNIEANVKHETAAEISEITGILTALNYRLRKYEDNANRTIIRAPMEGKVKYLYYTTEGGVVAPGAVVLDLVPSDGNLIIEARLSANEAVYVKMGQKARVRLVSAGPAGFGFTEGIVNYISADSIYDEVGNSYYIIKIKLKSDKIMYNDISYHLFSGENVICNILTGKRSLLSYFLSPFSNFNQNALTER